MVINRELSKTELNMDDGLTVADRTSFIKTNLENDPDYYIHNGHLTFLKVGFNPILGVDHSSMRVLLNQKYEFYRYKLVLRELVPAYKKLQEDIIDSLNYSVQHSNIRQVDSIAKHDIVLENESGKYELANLGYNKFSKVFVTDVLAPRSLRKILQKIISTFCFKNQIDEVNLIGMLLTKYFHHLFPGGVPIVRIEGNQKGLGKTLLALIISIIYQGKLGEMISLSDNEDELSKHLCSIALIADRVVVFDNAKVSKNLKEMGGAVLEKLISSPVHQFRILGKNKTVSVINNFLFILTTNGGETTSDLAARSILIELFRSGSTINVTHEIPDLLNFVKNNLEDIEAELLEYIKIWILKGSPKSSNVKHRFAPWAMVIGGVLEANGLNGFLSNQQSHESESGLIYEFQKCFHAIPKFTNLKARDLHSICNRENNYFNSYSTVANFSKKVLTSLIGVEFVDEGKTFVFESAGVSNDKSALFFIRRLDREHQEEQEQANILLLPKKDSEFQHLFENAGERK